MNDCRDIKKLLAAYSDGNLAPRDQARVEAHLKTCAACARELAARAEEGKVLKGLARIRATDDFLERVHARMERPQPARRWERVFSGPSWIKVPLEIAAAAAAVILIYAVAHEEPALYRPPAAPVLRMASRQEDEKAKAADTFSLKSTAESREAVKMDYAAAPLPRLRVSFPPAPDQDMAVGAARMAETRTADATGFFRDEKPAIAAAPPGYKARAGKIPGGGTGEDILSRIAETARLVGGWEVATGAGGAKSVEVEIPLPRRDDFLRRLGSIGEFEQTPLPPLPPDRETIRLRIEIL